MTNALQLLLDTRRRIGALKVSKTRLEHNSTKLSGHDVRPRENRRSPPLV